MLQINDIDSGGEIYENKKTAKKPHIIARTIICGEIEKHSNMIIFENSKYKNYIMFELLIQLM